MGSLKSFTASVARPLPVLILADTSASMGSAGKIGALNTALSTMVDTFAEEDEGSAQIHIGIVTFGGVAALHQPLAPASGFQFKRLSASGMTPMGGAFDIVRAMIEDKAQIPSRAYTPAIILVSDGQPNDEWRDALDRLLGSERAKKAQRFALGIGEDADADVLRCFLNDPEGTVYGANDAAQIKAFFRWVTMSVATRSRSANPAVSGIPSFAPTDLDALL